MANEKKYPNIPSLNKTYNNKIGENILNYIIFFRLSDTKMNMKGRPMAGNIVTLDFIQILIPMKIWRPKSSYKI